MVARAWDSFSVTCVHLWFLRVGEPTRVITPRREKGRPDVPKRPKSREETPRRGTVPPKTAHSNGRSRSWFPARGILTSAAVAGRIIGADEIGHDRGLRLRRSEE